MPIYSSSVVELDYAFQPQLEPELEIVLYCVIFV